MDLEDESGKEIHTNFTLKEILEEILNEKFRMGQNDYLLLKEIRKSRKTGFKFRTVTDQKIQKFILPKNVNNYHDWNAMVDAIEGKYKGRKITVER